MEHQQAKSPPTIPKTILSTTGIQEGRKLQNRKPVGNYPQEQQLYRTQEDIRKLELAIDSAQDLQSYNREDLTRIYTRVYEDPELFSQWNTLVLGVWVAKVGLVFDYICSL